MAILPISYLRLPRSARFILLEVRNYTGIMHCIPTIESDSSDNESKLTIVYNTTRQFLSLRRVNKIFIIAGLYSYLVSTYK